MSKTKVINIYAVTEKGEFIISTFAKNPKISVNTEDARVYSDEIIFYKYITNENGERENASLHINLENKIIFYKNNPSEIYKFDALSVEWK